MKKEKNPLSAWLFAIMVAILLATFLRIFIFEIIKVDGDSMNPTLIDGDRLIINKLAYRLEKPKRGEIIVFQYPQDRAFQFIKRIVAVEGDRVEIINGKVYLNEKLLNESYLLEDPSGNFYKRVIPRNTIFVLGDNRNNSKDSRYEEIGFIPLDLVEGKASFRIIPIDQFGKIKRVCGD